VEARNLPDFVEKQRAAVGRFEAAHAALGCAGKRAAFVSENFALQQILRKRGAMHRDEGRPRPRTRLVDRLGDEFFACARLALDQNRGARGRDEPHLVDHVLEFLRRADDAFDAEFLIEALVQLLHFHLERFGFQRALDQDFQPLDVHRLGQEIDSAAFHRFDRGVDISIRRHHENGGALRQRERLVDHLETGLSRHAQIGQHDIERLRIQKVERLIGTRGDRHIVTVRQSLLKALTSVFFVVDDQYGRHHARIHTSTGPAVKPAETARRPPKAFWSRGRRAAPAARAG
jgi:hypothetical protein